MAKLDVVASRPSRADAKRPDPALADSHFLSSTSDDADGRKPRKPRERKASGRATGGMGEGSNLPITSRGSASISDLPHEQPPALDLAQASMESELAGCDDGGADGQGDVEGRKGAWDPEEDQMLIALVEELGAKRWSLIAARMPGRIGKQVSQCVAAASSPQGRASSPSLKPEPQGRASRPSHGAPTEQATRSRAHAYALRRYHRSWRSACPASRRPFLPCDPD